MGGWSISEVDSETVAWLEVEKAGVPKNIKTAVDNNDVSDYFFKHVYDADDSVQESELDLGTLDWTGGGDHKGFYGTGSIKKLVFIIKCHDPPSFANSQITKNKKEYSESQVQKNISI